MIPCYKVPMRTSLAVFSMLLLVLIVPLSGCVDAEDIVGSSVGAPDPNSDPTNSDDIVLHEDVVLVEDSPCFSSVDVPEDCEILVFEFSCDPSDLGIEPGRIVVGVTDGGYLRRVISVTTDGWVLTLQTGEASIAEAIESGTVSIEVMDPSPEARSIIDFGNTTLYYGDVGPATVHARLDTAYVDFDPVLTMSGHWADGGVERFNSSIGLSIDGDIRATLSSTNGLRFDRSQDIAGWSWPFVFAIGPLPVAGVLDVKIKAGFRLDSPGHVTVSMGASGDLDYRTENEYRSASGWANTDIAENNWSLQEPSFSVSSSASARVYVRAELNGMLYGAVGPSSRSDLFISSKATAGCDGIEWDLNAGFSSKVMVKFNILEKFTPSKTFATAKFTADVASGTMDWPIGTPLPCGQEQIYCNDKVSGDTSVGYEALLDGYSCNVGNYDAPEAIWKWVANSDQTVNWSLISPVPTETNHDVMVLDGALGLVMGQCLTWGSNSIEFDAEAGQSYYLVVDGYDNDAGPYEAVLECEGSGASSNGGLGASDPF
jgi:hypothetical protein